MLIHKFVWDPEKLEPFLTRYSLGDRMSDDARMLLLNLMCNTDPDADSVWLITQYLCNTSSYLPPEDVVLRLIWQNLVGLEIEVKD